MRENSCGPRLLLPVAGLWAGLMLAGFAAAAAVEPTPAPEDAPAARPLVLAESLLNQEPKPRPLRVGASEPVAPAAPAGPSVRKKKSVAPARAKQPVRAKAAVKSAAKSAPKPVAKPTAKSGAKTKKAKKIKR